MTDADNYLLGVGGLQQLLLQLLHQALFLDRTADYTHTFRKKERERNLKRS